VGVVGLDFGIHDGIPAEEYHADPCTVPSLSASIANILVTRSPAHARAAHPKLNPELVREEESKFDIGTAAHSVLLQGVDIVWVVPFADWRTTEAKQRRDAARFEGKVPLLTDQAERVWQMVDAGRAQIHEHSAQPPLFTDGKPEQTLVWEDDHGVVCRARADWLRDDYATIDDYKSTSASAEPRKWERTMYGIGADVQVAFYLRGLERLTGVRASWRYVVQETYPPFALSVVDLAPSALALADAKVQKAIDDWAVCLERDEWPAYDRRVASIEVPTFEEMRWLERTETAAA
jgi:hypothetical protein